MRRCAILLLAFAAAGCGSLKDAFSTDVRPAIAEWARLKGLPVDPLGAFRTSGYLERITAERADRNLSSAPSYA